MFGTLGASVLEDLQRTCSAGGTLPSHHENAPSHCRRLPFLEAGRTFSAPSSSEALTPPAAQRETNQEVRNAKQDIPERCAACHPSDQADSDEEYAGNHDPEPDAAHLAAPIGAVADTPPLASTWRA